MGPPHTAKEQQTQTVATKETKKMQELEKVQQGLAFKKGSSILGVHFDGNSGCVRGGIF